MHSGLITSLGLPGSLSTVLLRVLRAYCVLGHARGVLTTLAKKVMNVSRGFQTISFLLAMKTWLNGMLLIAARLELLGRQVAGERRARSASDC